MTDRGGGVASIVFDLYTHSENGIYDTGRLGSIPTNITADENDIDWC